MGRAASAGAWRGIAWALLVTGCAAGSTGNGSSLSGASSVGSATSPATTTGGETDGASEGGASTSSAGELETSGGASTTADSTGSAETSCTETTWYLDGDGDGRGSPLATTLACEPPPGYVPFGDDCDDADPLRSPGAVEICDGFDTDCDGLVDEASPSNASCNGCELHDVGGRSYALCPAGGTFEAARAHCAALSGDLLRLDDAAEEAAVVALPEPPVGPAGGWLIGLSDVATEGTFVWIDGSGLDFTHWNMGEPNDAGGNEDCTEMDLAVGIWNDIPCTDPRAFVCESPAP